MSAGTAESSYFNLQPGDKRENTGNGIHLLGPQSLHPTPKHTSSNEAVSPKSFPTSFTNWGLSVQPYGTIGTIILFRLPHKETNDLTRS